jgi:hypothetical protein
VESIAGATSVLVTPLGTLFQLLGVAHQFNLLQFYLVRSKIAPRPAE